MPYKWIVVSFIETKLFTRLVMEHLTDDEYRALQMFQIEQPKAGTVITGSGGVRKLRWRAPVRGKRGGYRVIYYAKLEKGEIWVLTLYPKNVKYNIPSHVLRRVRSEVENG